MKLDIRDGKTVIIHDDKVVKEKFDDVDAALVWADKNIDDQVFDRPNEFLPAIEYDTDQVD